MKAKAKKTVAKKAVKRTRTNTVGKQPKRNRAEHLIPHQFQPGQSGNPNGRPPGRLNYNTQMDLALQRLAQEYVKKYNSRHKKKIRIEDVDIEGDIFLQLANKARAGDQKAIDSFLDRRHGKATQPVAVADLTGLAAGVRNEDDIREQEEWERKWENLGLVPEPKRKKDVSRHS